MIAETSTHPGYRADIDGLRAVSIVSVVIYHAFPAALPGGFIGVDIFFVISGYLITGIILRGIATERFSIGGFYRRRVQRIFPALILVLAFALVAGWFALLPQEYAALGKHLASGALFVPNIMYWTEAGYFDVDSMLKPLLHLWSLGVEEQFYLLWPVLLMLASRFRVPAIMLTGACMILSFTLGLRFLDHQASAFFLPQFRVWELLVGALLAGAMINRGRSVNYAPAANTLLSCVGLALIATGLVLINKERAFPGWWALIPTLGAALVIAAPTGRMNLLILGNPAMVFIGKISFPLYLWHWPLLSFARNMEDGEPSAGIKTSAVIVSVLLAWLSYTLVEKKLRYHPGKLIPYILTATLLALAALGFTVVASNGFPDRTTSLNELAAEFRRVGEGRAHRYKCAEDHPRAVYCHTTGPDPAVVVIGDSHARNTFYALLEHHKGSRVDVMKLERPECAPLLHVSNRVQHNADKCRQAHLGNIQWIADSPQVETVYLSSMGPMYLYSPKYELSYAPEPALRDHRDVFRRGLRDTVQKLVQSGKTVVVVIDWPSLPYMPTQCFDLRPLRLSDFQPRDCTRERKSYLDRNAEYLEIVLSLAREFPSLQYWNTPAAFCNDNLCRGSSDGRPLYRDQGHLSAYGAQYLGRRHVLSTAEDVKRTLLQ